MDNEYKKLLEIESKMDSLKTTVEGFESKLDFIIENFQDILKGQEVMNTQELCEYLKQGKSVVERLRQNGELTYIKVGKSYLYTRKDIETYFDRNRIKYVS